MKKNRTIEPLKRSVFTKRTGLYLLILLILQCIFAYGALFTFDALPESITGIQEDHISLRETQRGTISLLRGYAQAHPDLSAQQLIDKIQPDFGYPLALVSESNSLSSPILQSLANGDIGYNEDLDLLYAMLDKQHILQLGPIVLPDILEANTMSFSLYLLIWSCFSAMLFCLIFYIALADFWRDLLKICHIAEALSEGDLKARVYPIRSWLFMPLSKLLNRMASQIEEQLTVSQTVSHAMAHELRTPLSRMRFELRMLEDELSDKQFKSEYTQGIEQDITELESLINTSLSYLKTRQQQIELQTISVDLASWSQRLCHSIEMLKPVNFELTCHCEDIQANIDPHQMGAVIKNLLLNAFKYAHSKAVLSIQKKQSTVIIEVNDDGPGIPFSARESIFLPFSRLDTSRTKTEGGYGLGLYYVKLIAQAHQGNAMVLTSSLGGARFVINIEETI